MSEIARAATYYHFIKWMKTHYKAYYLLYGLHITVPGQDLQIRVDMGYIQPADKEQLKNIINEFNLRIYD